MRFRPAVCLTLLAVPSFTGIGAGARAEEGCPKALKADDLGITISGEEIELGPRARVAVRSGAAITIVGHQDDGRILVEVGQKLRLRGALGKEGFTRVFPTRDVEVAPGATLARGAGVRLVGLTDDKAKVDTLAADVGVVNLDCKDVSAAAPAAGPAAAAETPTHRATARTPLLGKDGRPTKIVIPADEPVRVLEKNGGKAHVRWTGPAVRFDGWVPENALAALSGPVAKTDKPRAAASLGVVSEATAQKLRAATPLRDAPSGPAVYTVPAGTTVYVTGRDGTSALVRLANPDSDFVWLEGWMDGTAL